MGCVILSETKSKTIRIYTQSKQYIILIWNCGDGPVSPTRLDILLLWRRGLEDVIG